jgi:hypothetical protein
MSIFDNPDARPVAYAYSDRAEPGLYPEPPAAAQAKALRLGKGTLAAMLLGTIAVGAALGFAVFDYAGSQPRPAVVAPSNGSPDSRPPAAPTPDPGQAVPAPDPGQVAPAPDPGQAAPAPPAAPDPGPVAAPPAPAPAPGNTNVIIGGGGGHPRDYGHHPHCHWIPPHKVGFLGNIVPGHEECF